MKINQLLLLVYAMALAAAQQIQTARAQLAVSQQAYLKASNTDGGDSFGASVAVSGDTIVIGTGGEDSAALGIYGNQLDNTATNSGAAYVFVRQGNTWVQQAYLKASNADSGDNFGNSVALSGNTLVVGAWHEDSIARGVNGDQSDNNGPESGAVYVFERTGANWVQQAYLKCSNTEFGERFGWRVAISGDTIVVGAHIESSGASGVNGDQFNNNVPAAGAAYVFVRTGTNWAQQAYLKASNPGTNDFFGYSVAISGDTIAVGAVWEDSNAIGVNGNQHDNSATNSGAVYVFQRTGTNWAQQAYLKASNTGADDEFGFSVSLLRDTLVVGARSEYSIATGVNGDQTNNSAPTAGAAYVFARTGTNWAQQAYLKASNTRFNSYFGWDVAVVGEDQVLIGSPFEWSNATGVDGNQTNIDAHFAGAAYLFERNGTNWSQRAYLKASNTDPSDNFGVSVAGTGDTIVIGASKEASSAAGVNGNQADNSATSAGAAYTFNLAASGAPLIVQSPIGGTRNAGNSVTLTCTALGTPPFTYEWRKDGVSFSDGAGIVGAQTPSLAVGRVLGGDSGVYRVVVSNSSGSVTSNPAMLTVLDPAIASHPSHQVLRPGEALSLTVVAFGTEPLSYRWFHDGVPLPGETTASLLIPSAQLTNSGFYEVSVSNALGAVRSAPASVLVHATPADSFDPRMSAVNPGPTYVPADVRALAIQPDGRFLVGGLFDDIGGISRWSLARFQSGGALDTTFQQPRIAPANRIGLLPDGRILANTDDINSGYFSRYLPGGTPDPMFAIPPGGVSGPASAVVVQQDGSVIFTQQDGPAFWSVRRLFPDGTPDSNFNVPVDGIPQLLALQRDGSILVAGQIAGIAGQPRAGIGRLDANGSLDNSFNPNAGFGDGQGGGWIESMAVQSDGKIVVTGGFYDIGGRTNNGIARLKSDGTADPGFSAVFDHCCPGIYANSIALQADGKIILGGRFDTLNDQPVFNLGRLNSDGSLDTTFNPAPDGEVTGLALDASGRLLVSGYFTHLGGQARGGVARLLNTGSATESLFYQGDTITWLRGGCAPDAWATTFELSTSGSNWSALGAGTPIAGGWKITGISAPVGSRIRARGFVASGYGNASRGMVESTAEVSLRLLAEGGGQVQFGFKLLGPGNQPVVIEGSTNLQNWIPLQTNVVPANGILPFADPDSATLIRRFYRGRAQ